MQFAISQCGSRTYIQEAFPDEAYYCPFCGSPMIQRRGRIKIPHFAHAKGYLCSDTWQYEEMTEWHKDWQGRYPIEYQEVVIEKNGVKHRADICIGNTVIEFQHSPISAEAFQERNIFYTSTGKQVIWLFDIREASKTKISIHNDDGLSCSWKHAPKTMTGFDLYGDVQVFFQIDAAISDTGKTIERLIHCVDGDLSFWGTDEKTQYNEASFVDYTIWGIRKKDEKSVDKLYHLVYPIRRTNKEMEYFGCPINPGGYAPMIREYSRRSCDDCRYCKEVNSSGMVKCTGRYRDHIDHIYTVLSIEEHPAESALLYLNQSRKMSIAVVDNSAWLGKTIIDLEDEYKPQKMIVRNLNSGREFKIIKSPLKMLLKYQRIYGYIRGSDGRFRDSCELYYSNRPDWIVTWFE